MGDEKGDPNDQTQEETQEEKQEEKPALSSEELEDLDDKDEDSVRIKGGVIPCDPVQRPRPTSRGG